jgi:chromosome segregation ATPase
MLFYASQLLSTYEDQIKDLSTQLETLSSQKIKFEQDLKDSIDKVFDLREIISDLEGQIQLKAASETEILRKCDDLENFIRHQNEGTEIMRVRESELVERITELDEQLKLVNPSHEQKLVYQQMSSQLKSVEKMLDRKINTLEAFHALASSCSATACSSPSEDVSKGFDVENFSEKSPIKTLMRQTDMPLEEISRILEKLAKHSRMEEATVKKVADLEMTINVMKNNLSVSMIATHYNNRTNECYNNIPI